MTQISLTFFSALKKIALVSQIFEKIYINANEFSASYLFLAIPPGSFDSGLGFTVSL